MFAEIELFWAGEGSVKVIGFYSARGEVDSVMVFDIVDRSRLALAAWLGVDSD